MAWYSEWSRFPRKATVWERQAEADRAVAKLEKRGKRLQPVELESSRIAETFWGKAWCKHVESYSDYENRLPRGRSYVRSGSVIDLRLEPGVVHALVSGSRVYTVKIDVTPLAKARWKELVAECVGQIDSVIALLQGELPDGVMTRLCEPTSGLFPTSKQLAMSCSCPDWAGLCKHLAAVLYGVGARLDREPELLFVLRGVDKLELVGEAAGGALAGSGGGEAAVAPDALGEIFGIELEPAGPAEPAKAQRSQGPAVEPRARPKRRGVARARAPVAQRRGGELDGYSEALERVKQALTELTRKPRERTRRKG